MSKQPTSSPHPIQDVSYKLGEECDYWLKFGEYVQQQAINDGWLDSQGKLTSAGLQAIISEQETNRQRTEHVQLLRSQPAGKKLRLKTSYLSPSGKGTSSGSRTRKNTKSEFIHEVKMYLAKVQGRFVHFEDEGDGCQLVIRIPNDKQGTTSHTFRGAISDIRRELLDFIERIEDSK